mgnify:CR=1 FL=1
MSDYILYLAGVLNEAAYHDKTKENLINRDEILSRIQNVSIVTISKPLDSVLSKKPLLSKIESSKIFIPEKEIPNDTFYITNIVKLKKNLI